MDEDISLQRLVAMVQEVELVVCDRKQNQNPFSTLVSCLVCYTINTILPVTSSVKVAVTVTIDTKMIIVTSKVEVL